MTDTFEMLQNMQNNFTELCKVVGSLEDEIAHLREELDFANDELQDKIRNYDLLNCEMISLHHVLALEKELRIRERNSAKELINALLGPDLDPVITKVLAGKWLDTWEDKYSEK